MRSSLALASIVAIVTAGGAVAAAPAVTLNLKGGFGNHTLKACGLTHHYTFFHRGRAIAIEGESDPPRECRSA